MIIVFLFFCVNQFLILNAILPRVLFFNYMFSVDSCTVSALGFEDIRAHKITISM